MKLPLAKRLKKRLHIEIGLLQDELIDLVYALDNSAILHGGTAIWRCYGGNRFSEDIDLYSKKLTESALKDAFASRRLEVKKLKKTQNLIFAKIAGADAEVRLEINLVAKASPVLQHYERIDGSTAPVLTLSPENLILEKIAAYNARKYMRDVYDIYHLLPQVSDYGRIKKALSEFAAAPPGPADEPLLKTLIYAGRAPTFNEILSTLRRGMK